tara:strand:+ start:108 stop:425 length:318 start_codon:yes stop_codon:yes gene_type:complete
MAYDSKLATEFLDELFDAILLLENREECYRFFEDVCTIKELQAISQRLKVAKFLRANKTYHEIEEITGASTATISRVNRCLLYGADGYNIILDRIDEEENTNEDK